MATRCGAAVLIASIACGSLTVGIGDGSNKKVQARCIVIERDYLKQNPGLEMISKDKALIAVHTTNDDTQHIPSYATHPDSRVSRGYSGKR
jgi:hypothetical protein